MVVKCYMRYIMEFTMNTKSPAFNNILILTLNRHEITISSNLHDTSTSFNQFNNEAFKNYVIISYLG